MSRNPNRIDGAGEAQPIEAAVKSVFVPGALAKIPENCCPVAKHLKIRTISPASRRGGRALHEAFV